MPIRTILVLLDGADGSRSAMETAFAVGRELGAHVDALHVRADPKDVVPLLGEGMSGAMIEEMFDLAEKEAADRSAKARAAFDEYCAKNSIALESKPGESERGQGGTSRLTAAWVEKTGREDEIAARNGRLADLIVIAQSASDADVSSVLTMNAVLFESGRPVLMVPAGTTSPVGRKAAIAWNGSAQASRAIGASVTLLARAGEVAILSAEGDTTSAATAPELVTYLAWHGIGARVQAFTPTSGRQVGEAVLRECADSGAGLLVMGAYTHSRMRQLILGGVTRNVLAEAKIPVLLAH